MTEFSIRTSQPLKILIIFLELEDVHDFLVDTVPNQSWLLIYYQFDSFTFKIFYTGLLSNDWDGYLKIENEFARVAKLKGLLSAT